MKLLNEAAAGEFTSHKGQIKRDKLAAIKERALIAMREARFADYDAAEAEYYEMGGTEDLESYVSNIVSVEIERDDK